MDTRNQSKPVAKNLQNKPSLITNINLESLILRLMEQSSAEHKEYPRAPISYDAYQFAKNIIESCYLPNLRPDNFCINLVDKNLENWTKEQYRAFGKLFISLSDVASLQLKLKQDQNLDITKDAQLLFLQLPKQNDKNLKVVNGINKKLLNHGYQESTGNEEAITLSRFINAQKKNPITPCKRITYSVSLVIVTENDQVLLLKRGGLSGRAGSWGTLTGKVDQEDGSKEKTLIREVHEEINVLIADKQAHYVGSVQTNNLSKDLVKKGKAVSFSDDCSFVYGIIIPEHELLSSIKLDSENCDWRLFSRNELNAQFKVHSHEVHGQNFNQKEMHVALAKSLLVLDASKNNFENVEEGKINYPYTNSPGFFARYKSSSSIKANEAPTETISLIPRNLFSS